MRLNRHPQRCPPGKRGRMARLVAMAVDSITEEGAGVAEVATTSMVAGEGVVTSGVEDTIGVEEEEAEVVRSRVDGQMVEVVVVVEVIKATTKMDMEVDIRGEGGEEAMEEGEEVVVGDTRATKEVLTIPEVEVTMVEVDTSRMATTKTEAAPRRGEVGVAVAAEEEEAVAGEVDKEEAGVAEEVRTTTKADSSNSSSSTEAISTISRASAKATIQAETAKTGHHSKVCASMALELGRAHKENKSHRDVHEGDW